MLLDKKISAILKEGVVFSLREKNSHPSYNRLLEHSDLIGLHDDEKIIEVQRQHWVKLVFPIFLSFLLTIIVFSLVTGLLIQEMIEVPGVILVDFFLVGISFILSFIIFSFMYWHYQFYIITNRCLMHKHFFKLGGYSSEEFFIEASPEREIAKEAQNPILSLLGVENVTVYFQRPGLDCFVFEAPQDAQRISNALEAISLNKGDKIK